MFRLGLLVGMRPGELAGLRWGDVDFERGDPDRWPRCADARRPRRPCGRVEDVGLASHDRAAGGSDRRAARAAAANASGTRQMTRSARGRLVFPSRRGTVLEPSNVRRELTRICAAAEVPRITPNELRHTCATLLNDDGVPLELIADMLGHTTTLDAAASLPAPGPTIGRRCRARRWIRCSVKGSISRPRPTRGRMNSPSASPRRADASRAERIATRPTASSGRSSAG